MKLIQNTYSLENAATRVPPEKLREALTDFEVFMSNYAQVVGKDRHMHPFKLNAFQRVLFSELLPLISKETRLERQLNICISKPRQVGCTTGMIAFINYICAYLNDFEHASICHVLPVADTTSKLYKKKIEPIISGIHPDLFANIERENLGSSILTHYRDIKGVPRDNYYEVVSAGASSIRSDTINIAIFDEIGFYRKPEVIIDATLGSMPDYGFSLAIYMSTFENRNGNYFLDKLKTARDNPGDWKLIFVPWYIMYPEKPMGVNLDDIVLTQYDEETIIPALIKDDIPKSRWGDCVDWYHKKSRSIANMKKEFPTTLDEILELGEDDRVFSEEVLSRQDENILSVPNYSLLADTVTGKIEAKSTDDATPLKIYVPPAYGHKYRICIDPITSISETSDYFAMQVMDIRTHEQVAVFHGKQMSDEDYADYAVNLAKLYNNAQLCPEVNVASGFIVGVNSRHYYNWYYASKLAHNNKIIGLRTTATSKPVYLDKLKTLLDTGGIKIHDPETLQELRNFVKKTKGSTVKYEGKGKTHDDLADSLFLYAGSLNISDLKTTSAAGWSFL